MTAQQIRPVTTSTPQRVKGVSKKLEIKVPPVETRVGWTHIEDLPYTPEEIVEIVGRYCDAQDHAKAYRVRRAAKIKLMEQALEDAGIDLDNLEA